MKPWTSLSFLLLLATAATAQKTIGLEKLDLKPHAQGWAQPQIDRSIREKPLAIAGKKVRTRRGHPCRERASGSNSTATRNASRPPSAWMMPRADRARVVFHVLGDGKELWTSGVMKPNEKAKTIDLDLRGVKRLLLLVDDAGDGIKFDHADWANARFTFRGRAPRAIDPPNPGGKGRAAHAAARPGAEDQRAQGLCLRPKASVPLSHSRHGPAADGVHRRRTSRRSRARCRCGHHPRRDRRERRISRHAPRKERPGPGRAAAEDRLRRHAGPDAADGLEQLVHPL